MVQDGTRKPRAKILVVDDDYGIAQALTDFLGAGGYQVFHAATAAEAKSMIISEVEPDLVILDLMLPDTDGLVLCADLKARRDVPIIICSATHRQRDPVIGLKLGADDFVAKPFVPAELEARVEAVLRRAASARPLEPAVAGGPAAAAGLGAPRPAGSDGDRTPDHYRVGSLSIEHARRRVSVGGHTLQLTPTEYRLLLALASRPDEVVTRDELAQVVWGSQDASIGRAIDVHIRRLRVKMMQGPAPSPEIVSVRGFGYRLVKEPPKRAVQTA